MFDILFARVFCIVGAMLLITGAAARINTGTKNGRGAIIGVFVLLFAVMFTADMFPINLILVALFSAAMGWLLSPGIHSMGERYKEKTFIKENGIKLEKGQSLSEKQLLELDSYLQADPSNEEWNKILYQAMLSTALAIFATSSLVFLSDIDFSFMGMFLFIGLIILIVMGLLNVFFFKSRIFSLVKAYFGVLIFTGYLIYDFNTLEKFAGDDSWGTAVHIAVNIYLDIINLFLYILEILSES